MDGPIVRVAVVTGAHSFDVVAFSTMLRSLAGIDAYLQHLEDFVDDPAGVEQYQPVVFFNFHRETPRPGADELMAGTDRTVRMLLDRGAGIVLLHYALVAFPDWQVWSQLRGIEGFGHVRE